MKDEEIINKLVDEDIERRIQNVPPASGMIKDKDEKLLRIMTEEAMERVIQKRPIVLAMIAAERENRRRMTRIFGE